MRIWRCVGKTYTEFALVLKVAFVKFIVFFHWVFLVFMAFHFHGSFTPINLFYFKANITEYHKTLI
jgi:hypothetical protein